MTIAAILRGSLAATGLTARHIVGGAKNPCQRRRVILMVGSTPDAVASKVFGGNVDDRRFSADQSKMAMANGIRFETEVFGSGAARLISCLQAPEVDLLGQCDTRILDLRQVIGARPTQRSLAVRRPQRLTEQALRRRATDPSKAYNIIIQPVLELQLGDGEIVLLRPDALVAPASVPYFAVTEVKSYLSARHLTDQGDVGSALAQAGLYHYLLENLYLRLGLPRPPAARAVLVLRKPGSMTPVATIQRIDRDVSNASRLLAQRPRTLADVVNLVGPGAALDEATAVLRIPANYEPGCRSYCGLADFCRKAAEHCQDPISLGKDVAELVGSTIPLSRVQAIMAGEVPVTPDEIALGERIAAAMAELGAVA